MDRCKIKALIVIFLTLQVASISAKETQDEAKALTNREQISNDPSVLDYQIPLASINLAHTQKYWSWEVKE